MKLQILCMLYMHTKRIAILSSSNLVLKFVSRFFMKVLGNLLATCLS